MDASDERVYEAIAEAAEAALRAAPLEEWAWNGKVPIPELADDATPERQELPKHAADRIDF